VVGIEVLFFVGLPAGFTASLFVMGSEDGLKVGLVLGLLDGLVVGTVVGFLVGRKTGRREGLALLEGFIDEGFIDGFCDDGAALGLNVVESIPITLTGILVTSNIAGSNEVGWKVVGSIDGSKETG
jgi:hypothetical protein